MPIHNTDIATLFNRIADLLDIKGDNPFRIRAYRDAARTIAESSGSIAEMVEKGRRSHGTAWYRQGPGRKNPGDRQHRKAGLSPNPCQRDSS